jgi:endonuclease I
MIARLDAMLWIQVFSILLLIVTGEQDAPIFDGCDPETYYASFDTSNLQDWTRTRVEELLTETHRQVLPYTDTDKDDVWKALIDLDAGDVSGTVQLVYRQVSVPATPHGTPDTWNREHLYPKSRGVFYSGPDFTDIHHLRPSDWNVNSARGNKHFGECGVVEDYAECESPATPEAAEDTETDREIFRPPGETRGDISRALFYMDIRYEYLELTDCPTRDEQMGYLSMLLEWHDKDPVTDSERARNQQACERWQGNRNVFVDFPELVPVFFGEPQTTMSDGSGYPCDGESESVISPTTTAPSSTAGTDSLAPGDVMVVAVHSDDPDLVALVALEDVPGNLDLFLTDNAWTGSDFLSNEGTMVMRTPGEGIPRGTIFGYGPGFGDDWESVSGRFALSASGDSVSLYYRTENGDIAHLCALSFSGPWSEEFLDSYETDSSSLPDALSKVGSTRLEHVDNYVYAGPVEGSKASLQAALSDETNWVGFNSYEQQESPLQTEPFSVLASSAASNGYSPTRCSWSLLVLTLVASRI